MKSRQIDGNVEQKKNTIKTHFDSVDVGVRHSGAYIESADNSTLATTSGINGTKHKLGGLSVCVPVDALLLLLYMFFFCFSFSPTIY